MLDINEAGLRVPEVGKSEKHLAGTSIAQASFDSDGMTVQEPGERHDPIERPDRWPPWINLHQVGLDHHPTLFLRRLRRDDHPAIRAATKLFLKKASTQLGELLRVFPVQVVNW
jgi:hypothetical protein